MPAACIRAGSADETAGRGNQQKRLLAHAKLIDDFIQLVILSSARVMLSKRTKTSQRVLMGRGRRAFVPRCPDCRACCSGPD